MDKKQAAGYKPGDIFLKLETSINGLSKEEAESRIKIYGLNYFKRTKNNTLKLLLNQFHNSLIYLLIFASLISFFLGDFSDGIVISIILLVNSMLGFVQEYRSEKVIETLSQFINRQVLVIRGGKTKYIDEKYLVPGDITVLREGDVVPADIKIIKSEDLEVNESQLTGESVPVRKNSLSPGNSSTLLFTGSIIGKGEARGAVYATGDNTELGKIASLTSETNKETQYEKSLKVFSGFVMRIMILTLVIIFITKVLISHDFSNITSLFLFLVALAVTIIPEALPVIAVVTLSEGALKLAKKNVVVRKLSALEDLGNVNLLCTDKTGTLTENKLSVVSLTSDNGDLFKELAYASIEDLTVRKKRHLSIYDEVFEEYIPKEIKYRAENWEKVREIPFDPDARRRRVILKNTKHGKFLLVEIGSAETLLEISETNKKSKYRNDIIRTGIKGIRHLGISYKKINYSENFNILKNEDGLEFLGYVALVDPLRPTAKLSIETAEKLGIKVKILTGDSKEVADYVGRNIGLLDHFERVYTGEEILALPEEKRRKIIEICDVFAKVTPIQKYQIIEVLKINHIVGYQGDGINDAPSLKLADVAIAVNNATNVAKDSSDIILLKKDLSVIISAIKYGRETFININKYIKHTMVGNLGNFLSFAILYLVSAKLPLLPIQLLLVSLIQDIPLISIYSDNVDLEEIKKPGKFNIKSLMFLSLFLGTVSAVFDFIYMSYIGFRVTPITQTSLFLFFSLTQLVVIFSVRNKNALFKGKKPSNLVLFSIFVFLIFTLFIPYVPYLARPFSFVPLPLVSLITVLVVTLVYLIAIDYIKVEYFKTVKDP